MVDILGFFLFNFIFYMSIMSIENLGNIGQKAGEDFAKLVKTIHDKILNIEIPKKIINNVKKQKVKTKYMCKTFTRNKDIKLAIIEVIAKNQNKGYAEVSHKKVIRRIETNGVSFREITKSIGAGTKQINTAIVELTREGLLITENYSGRVKVYNIHPLVGELAKERKSLINYIKLLEDLWFGYSRDLTKNCTILSWFSLILLFLTLLSIFLPF